MGRMRSGAPWFAAFLLAACASVPCPPSPGTVPADAPVPDALLGLPAAVIVGRALFDLDSGDPERMERARCVLLSVPGEEATGPLLARVRAAPRGSAARLEALALLAERGEPLAGVEPAEMVAMSLREITRGDPSGRAAVLAAARIRALGEAALPALREEARPGAPLAEAAEGFSKRKKTLSLIPSLFGVIVRG